MRPRTAIIGGGIAGLVAAAILSRHMDVVVLERSEQFGGKIQTRELDGRKVDCGPTVLTLRSVFDTVFGEAGTQLDEHLELSRLDTLARHFWSDGSSLDLFPEAERSYEAIEAFSSRKSAEQYLRFCKLSESIFDTLAESFLLRSAPDFLGLIKSRPSTKLLGLNPFDSLWQVLSRTFDDPRLVQLFARYATYCGASPFECPATLMLVAHVERLGVWSLPGGIIDLAKALQQISLANGAELRTGSHVQEIEIGRQGVAGVRLSTGETIAADSVICTGDIASVAKHILGRSAAKAIGHRRTDQNSQSAMTWTFAAKASGVELGHHNVFFSDDYAAEFDAVFQRQAVPSAPTVYLCAPSPEEVAPKFSLINAPAIGDRHTFSDEEIEQCQTRMMDTLQACGLTLELHAGTVEASTPTDYAKRYPGTGGALYGPASHGWQAAFKRQGIRTRKPGLFMAGGSVHPGPGLPMAALSGRAAAWEVLSDFGLISRRRLEGTLGGISMA